MGSKKVENAFPDWEPTHLQFPKPRIDASRVITQYVGMYASNGQVGMNNPVFKQPNMINVNGYEYRYVDIDGREIEIKVNIKE